MMSSGARDLHGWLLLLLLLLVVVVMIVVLLCQVISPLKCETTHIWNGTCIKHINLMHFKCHSKSFYGQFPLFTLPLTADFNTFAFSSPDFQMIFYSIAMVYYIYF